MSDSGDSEVEFNMDIAGTNEVGQGDNVGQGHSELEDTVLEGHSAMPQQRYVAQSPIPQQQRRLTTPSPVPHFQTRQVAPSPILQPYPGYAQGLPYAPQNHFGTMAPNHNTENYMYNGEPIVRQHGFQPHCQNIPRISQGHYGLGGYGYTPQLPMVNLKPEPFNGEGDWDEYISHFENCAELGKWTEPNKALMLSACLRGPARIFYLGLTPAEKRSYSVLVCKLDERFGSTRQQNRWLTKFEARKRQPNEAISSLGDDLRLMAQRAYPELGQNAQESLALHQLYKAISLEMKCRCIDRDCKTVADAIEVIERYEAILGEPTDKKKGTVRMTTHYENSIRNGNSGRGQGQSNTRRDHQKQANKDDKRKQDENLNETLKQIMDRLDRVENVRPRQFTQRPTREKPACFICGSTEHFFKQCQVYLECQKHQESSKAGSSKSENQGEKAESQENSKPSTL